MDDERPEAIVRDHVNFPPELWDALERHDVYISGEEAVAFGIAHEIGGIFPACRNASIQPLGMSLVNTILIAGAVLNDVVL